MNIAGPAFLNDVIAHRGASGTRPENTQLALQHAIDLGAQCVEIDVSISADGVPFVHHDDTLDRCTNGSGYLCAHSSEALDLLDAARLWPDFSPEPLPRLDSVLALLQQHNTGLNLEIKPTPGLDHETTEAICDCLQHHWTSSAPLVLSSFSRRSLDRARQLQPDWARAWIVCAVPNDWEAQLDELACRNLHCAGELLSEHQVKAIKASGRGVYCFTVNDPQDAERLKNMGVDGVFTDYPERLLNI